MSEIILESRITMHNPTVENKTHEIVVDRLIELWQTEPDNCLHLFKVIAKHLASYDLRKKPYKHYNTNTKRFEARVIIRGKQQYLGGSKSELEVNKIIQDWLRFNR
jgi:hypothetical protein